MIIYTDGGSRGNPGYAAIGVVVINAETKETLFSKGECIGITTNNVAEYEAVLKALEFLSTLPHSPDDTCEFRADSLLVVSQITGKYKVKNPEMLVRCQKVHRWLSDLPFSVTFTAIPRAQNAAADALVNRVLDENMNSLIRQEKKE